MLPVALGLSDGILNALTLAAGRLSSSTSPMTMGLALRISLAAGVASVFMLFVAAYAQLRRELVHADEQLNVLAPGRMAASRQGPIVLREAGIMACVSGVCSFVGSAAPLLFATILGADDGIFAIVAAIAALVLLGAVLARVVYGHWVRWTLGMAAAGVAVSALGMWLHIV